MDNIVGAQDAEVRAEIPPYQNSPPGPPRILVVDDDRYVGEMLNRTLTRAGYQVQQAASYEEAAQLLSMSVFHTAVVDICLGDHDGLELLADTHTLTPDLPVILVTGYPTVETATAAVRLNAYEYLTKPVQTQRLTQAVGRAVELKFLRDAKQRAEQEKRNYQRDLEELVAARTQRLIQSHNRFQLLFENSKDAIFMATWNGEFLAINQAAVDLFGYDKPEMIKAKATALFAAGDRYEALRKEIRSCGFVKDFGVQFQRKDGTLIDCLFTAHLLTHAQGETEGYQGIIRDVTAQKQAEQKIKAQNAFLKNVIESLAHPFMVIDAHDFSVKVANAAALKGSAMEGLTCHDLNHGLGHHCSRQGIRCPVEEVVASRQPVHLEHIHCGSNGHMEEHAVHAFPLLDQNHQVIQVIQYCIDITERKQLETIAEAANLMENLGFIFSGIRHEIGNPINSVKMALSVLSMNLDQYESHTIREFLQRALGEITRMEYLLKALKNFSLYETPDLEPVSINQFVHSFKSLVEKDFAAKGIRITADLPRAEVTALTDERAFHQVLLNLFTNASDAFEHTECPEIQIIVTSRSPFVQVQVRDNGNGMSESEMRNLFRPFFTSKPQGTGLGLVIVRKMLSKMNSAVKIESELTKGTTVTMTLPEGTPGNRKDPETPEIMTQTKKNLLVIDDDRFFCDTVQHGLADLNVNVITAATGAEGVGRSNTDTVDVVLLDQKLPDGNGINFCLPLLERNEGAKIIFITAFPSFENAVQAIKVGAHDYLSKPFDIGELRLAVSQALRTSALERVEQVQHFQQQQEIRRSVLIGARSGLAQVQQLIDLAADQPSPVLITGETGTGKTLVAKAIHYGGQGDREAFIAVNCAAIPENLMEAELFGHEKGAFTGAVAAAKGLFEMADQGTLFLDEIGDLPLHLQAKLLGVLDDHLIRRVGGQTVKAVKVRIIAATNADLAAAIQERRFREDLYYRFSVVHIHVPPLRDRIADIPDLCRHFIRQIAPDQQIHLPEHELQALGTYHWPGNIRELRNIIERAILVRRGSVIQPAQLLGQTPGAYPHTTTAGPVGKIQSLDEIERSHIRSALVVHKGNHTHTAKALGISRSTLVRKIRRFHLENTYSK